MIDYNDRYFRPLNNTANGETSSETIFHYKQAGKILSADYAGGKIIKGQLLGVVSDDGRLDFCYHQINDKGEIMTGRCVSFPELMPGGKIKLHEKWKWTSGDFSEGESAIIEI